MKKIKEIIDDLFDLPRRSFAWIVFHLAQWLNMRPVSSIEDEKSIEENFFEILEDLELEDLEEDE